jgi:hypothetical protein
MKGKQTQLKHIDIEFQNRGLEKKYKNKGDRCVSNEGIRDTGITNCTETAAID